MNEIPENKASGTPCPEPETLSSFFDKESELNAQDAAHVKVCKVCGRRLDDYGRISTGVKCAISEAESSDLLARVKAGVHEKLKREGALESPKTPRSIDFPYWISSIAACLAVCALGFYLVSHMERPNNGAAAGTQAVAVQDRASGDALARVAVQPSALKAAELSTAKRELAAAQAPVPAAESRPMLAEAKAKAVRNEAAGAIDLKDLASVSFGGDDGASLIAGSVAAAMPAQQRPAYIERNVNHVWTAAPGAMNKLASIENAIGVRPTSMAVAPDGSPNPGFVMSRRQAVMFVRALKVAGFELLSPQQPQPEQSVFSGSGDEPVVYDARFIVKK